MTSGSLPGDGRDDPSVDCRQPAPESLTPDLRIVVRQAGEHGRTLKFGLKARALHLKLNYEPVGSVRLEVEPRRFFEQRFRDLGELPLYDDDAREKAGTRLESEGVALAKQLLPPGLNERLWQLRDQVTTVQILSDETWIPWELLKLWRWDKHHQVMGPFLCEAFALTRWRFGVDQHLHLPLRNLALVTTLDPDLAAAATEREDIGSLGGEGRAIHKIPSTYRDVIGNLATGKFDGWHFIGHGLARAEDPNRWSIALKDFDRITPEDLNGEAANLGNASPLVFLNACHTGTGALSLTGMGGWAVQLLDVGAGAFIGASWATTDQPAKEFAMAFYREFLRGTPIGEAGRRARLEIRERFPGDPTWLAYAVFAHPLARCIDAGPLVASIDGLRVDHWMTRPMKPPLVFLSHSRADESAAQELTRRLRQSGLEVWLDLEELRPSEPWHEPVELALARADAFAVYVGSSGVQDWVDMEMRLALTRSVEERRFLVVPILGPGAEAAALPGFLRQYQAVDLSAGSDRCLEWLVAAVHETPVAAPQVEEAGGLLPPGEPPFQGLRAFHAKQAHLFFGRDREVEELLQALRRDYLLTVVGDSGSGKSSLVRAGLLPALFRGRFRDGDGWGEPWRIAVLRPGEDPFRNLAEVLPELGEKLSHTERAEFIDSARKKLRQGAEHLGNRIAALVPAGFRALLVVDQFEELFTPRANPGVRRDFVDALLAAASPSTERPVHVLIVLRADFYYRCWEHPELPQRIAGHQYAVQRMDCKGLRQVIEKPLVLAGARLEPGLAEVILDDVGEEPGNLPLLEHTLLRLWEDRTDQTLTHHSYENMGRLRGAVARHANAIYEKLDHQQQQVARRIFLDLVQPGEATGDTRRSVGKSDILSRGEDPAVTETVLELLATGRLVTTGWDEAGGAEMVELAHEILVREWPRLRGWLDEDRDFLLWRRRLQMRLEEWKAAAHDEGALLHGRALAEAQGWEYERATDLDVEERELIRLSGQAQERRHRHELRRTRAFAMVVAIGFLIASFLGIFAKQQVRKTEEQLARNYRLNAITALEEGVRDRAAHFLARSVTRERDDSRVKKAILGVHAFIGAPFLQNAFQHERSINGARFSVDGRLLLTWSDDGTARLWKIWDGSLYGSTMKHENSVSGAVFSSNEQLILTWSQDGTARLWNVEDGSPVGRLMEHDGPVLGATFSANERLILTECVDGNARLWDIGDRSPKPRVMKHEDYAWGAVFSSDERRILTWSPDGTARLWNSDDVSPTGQIMRHPDGVQGAEFSSDERFILTSSLGGPAHLWSIEDGSSAVEIMRYGDAVVGAEFSSDERLILTWSWDGTARLWNVEDGSQVTEDMEHEAVVVGAAFSSNERLILTWSQDGTARVWNSEDGSLAAQIMQHEGPVDGAEFSSDERLILTWSQDGTARLWNTRYGSPASRSMQHDGPVNGAMFSPDEASVLTWGQDGIARLWNIAYRLCPEVNMQHDGPVRGAVFNSDEHLILSWSEDGTVRLWNAEDGALAAQIMQHEGGVEEAVFSSDKRLILTWGKDGIAQLWNTGDGSPAAQIMKHDDSITGALFSSDERLILTWSEDGTARLWNTEDGSPAAPVIKHGVPIVIALFSSDERLILTWSENGTVRLWNTEDGSPAAPIIKHGDTLHGANFGVDDSLVFTWHVALRGGQGKIRLWNIEDGLPTGQTIDHDGPIFGVTFSSDKRLGISWSAFGTVRLWNTKDGSLGPEIIDHEEAVFGALLNSDEKLLVTWTFEGGVRVFNIDNGSLAAPVMRHGGIVEGGVLTSDNRVLLTWSEDGMARLWNTETGLPAGKMQHAGQIGGAKFSSDERLILTWSADGTARLWNIEDGSSAAPVMQHVGPVMDAVFNSEDRFILTASVDGTVRLWNISADYDFPSEHLSLLVEVSTGTMMDDAGDVTALSVSDWRDRRESYVGISEAHLKRCRYRHANLYVRQRAAWEGGSRKP